MSSLRALGARTGMLSILTVALVSCGLETQWEAASASRRSRAAIADSRETATRALRIRIAQHPRAGQDLRKVMRAATTTDRGARNCSVGLEEVIVTIDA